MNPGVGRAAAEAEDGSEVFSANERSADLSPFLGIDFGEAEKLAGYWANHIENNFAAIADILLEYESYEVVEDETALTLDLLRSLDENADYFRLRVGPVAAFLPRNQPLYAFACFVIVPSLMASEVHFRIPHAMRHFFPKMLEVLAVSRLFPNVFVSPLDRLEFLRERSALIVDSRANQSWPVTDAVIFTGTSEHADQLKRVFDRRTLFIANGAGHNPVVVSGDADIEKAADAVVALSFYNQGQDCAAPNAILVQAAVHAAFLQALRKKIDLVGVGAYGDRQNRVGPISEPRDLVRIQGLLIEQRAWLDTTTPGTIRAYDATVEPTIICKSLEDGANFTELFAPIVFVQEYMADAELESYFEHPRYARNAMYVSLYGSSNYVQGLVGRPIAGRVLHPEGSVLFDTHLHALGEERGTQPYGGYGDGASSLSIDGKRHCKPTLPQRDIDEWVAGPLLSGERQKAPSQNIEGVVVVPRSDISKLLKLKQEGTRETRKHLGGGTLYVDTIRIERSAHRYVRVDREDIYELLTTPNLEYMANLAFTDRQIVRGLRDLLLAEAGVERDDLADQIYAKTNDRSRGAGQDRARQRVVFTHIYQLLFGTASGPRLAPFLIAADRARVCELLDA
jgi:lysyl-tRNA synthetase class 1